VILFLSFTHTFVIARMVYNAALGFLW